jgi:hypothetical protein
MYRVRMMLHVVSICWMVASSAALLSRFPSTRSSALSSSSLLMSGLFGEQATLDRKRGASELSVVSQYLLLLSLLLWISISLSHCAHSLSLVLCCCQFSYILQDWQIYIDQSKSSLDRGASATLDAFCGLCPPHKVQVIAAILPKSNKKTPWVRCISKVPGRSSIDVANVDSVDKVYRILTKHLQVKVRDEQKCVAS